MNSSMPANTLDSLANNGVAMTDSDWSANNLDLRNLEIERYYIRERNWIEKLLKMINARSFAITISW